MSEVFTPSAEVNYKLLKQRVKECVEFMDNLIRWGGLKTYNWSAAEIRADRQAMAKYYNQYLLQAKPTDDTWKTAQSSKLMSKLDNYINIHKIMVGFQKVVTTDEDAIKAKEDALKVERCVAQIKGVKSKPPKRPHSAKPY